MQWCYATADTMNELTNWTVQLFFFPVFTFCVIRSGEENAKNVGNLLISVKMGVVGIRYANL